MFEELKNLNVDFRKVLFTANFRLRYGLGSIASVIGQKILHTHCLAKRKQLKCKQCS